MTNPSDASRPDWDEDSHGPFASGPVDALVYAKDDDEDPELRYVPQSMRPRVLAPLPATPDQFAEVTPWEPGPRGKSRRPRRRRHTRAWTLIRSGLIALIPLALMVGLFLLVTRLYEGV